MRTSDVIRARDKKKLVHYVSRNGTHVEMRKGIPVSYRTINLNILVGVMGSNGEACVVDAVMLGETESEALDAYRDIGAVRNKLECDAMSAFSKIKRLSIELDDVGDK